MEKILWIDIETTGLVPGKHGIIQIGALVTNGLGGDVIDEFEMKCNAGQFEITERALEVNGLSKKELDSRETSPLDMLYTFVEFLDRHINRYDKEDKFTPIGYNSISFDMPFLREWSLVLKFPYMNSLISHREFDVLVWLRMMNALGHFDMENFKLENACEYFGVKLKAHDAMADIKATRKVFRKAVKQCAR